MNLYIAVGVIVGKPILQSVGAKDKRVIFKMATVDEVTNKDIYVNCIASMNVGYNIYTKCNDGSPIVIRGHLGFNKQKNSNYVQVTYVQLLFDSMSKPVQMGLKEFLDIYNPQTIVSNMRELEKEQRKAKKEDSCLDMQQSSDISSQEQ